MGNTLAVIQCLSTLAPEVDQSPLDRAVSGAVEHAFKTNKTNRIAIAGAPDSGLTVTLGDVVFHLARNN
jgi:hypothetical protein